MDEDTADARTLETYYLRASGSALDDCCFLGQRYDSEWGYKARDSESWVMRNVPARDGATTTSIHLPTDTHLTDVWMSPTGAVYVSDSTRGAVYRCPRLWPGEPEAWSQDLLPAAIQGLWGFSDEYVYAWGGAGDRHPMFHWDGARWNDMPAPGFEVYALHGLTPELFWAVGVEGQVAVCERGAWRAFPTPTGETLVSVFAVSPDEVYACGNQGSLLEGSHAGFGRIAEGPVPGLPLFAVAWWNDALWVGARQFGLLRRVERTSALEVVKPNVWALAFDARVSLVITTPQFIAGTSDGATFRAAAKGALETQLENVPLLDPVRRR